MEGSDLGVVGRMDRTWQLVSVGKGGERTVQEDSWVLFWGD